MKRANPVDIRKSLELVETMKKAGIDFVPIPVMSESDKLKLIALLQNRLASMESLTDG